MTTQRSTVHVADRDAPHNAGWWVELSADQHSRLCSLGGYLFQVAYRNLMGAPLMSWDEEEADLGRLSKRFPDTLFVSASECTSEWDGPMCWRMFALDGETWRTIETDGVWAQPLLLGLDS